VRISFTVNLGKLKRLKFRVLRCMSFENLINREPCVVQLTTPDSPKTPREAFVPSKHACSLGFQSSAQWCSLVCVSMRTNTILSKWKEVHDHATVTRLCGKAIDSSLAIGRYSPGCCAHLDRYWIQRYGGVRTCLLRRFGLFSPKQASNRPQVSVRSVQ